MEANVYIDGGARGNPGPAGSGYLVKSPGGEVLASESHFIDHATNNQAEYIALIRALRGAADLGISELNIFSDSELLVRQIIGIYRVKNPALKELFEQAQRALLTFNRWQIRHIPREQNSEADDLVNSAIDEGLRQKTSRERDTARVSGQSEPQPPASAAAATMKVLVEVMTEGDPEICSAGLRKGQCFVFSNVTPGGLCMRAMQDLLPAVAAMQGGQNDRQVVRCTEPGCRAVFQLTAVR